MSAFTAYSTQQPSILLQAATRWTVWEGSDLAEYNWNEPPCFKVQDMISDSIVVFSSKETYHARVAAKVIVTWKKSVLLFSHLLI